MSERKQQAVIPQPAKTLDSLHAVALATKELVETLAGQRRSQMDAAVTWGDLLRLGIVKPEQLPK